MVSSMPCGFSGCVATLGIMEEGRIATCMRKAAHMWPQPAPISHPTPGDGRCAREHCVGATADSLCLDFCFQGHAGWRPGKWRALCRRGMQAPAAPSCASRLLHGLPPCTSVRLLAPDRDSTGYMLRGSKRGQNCGWLSQKEITSDPRRCTAL